MTIVALPPAELPDIIRDAMARAPRKGKGVPLLSPRNNYVAEGAGTISKRDRGKPGAPFGNRNAAVSPEVAAVRRKVEALQARARAAIAMAQSLIAQQRAAIRKTVLIYSVYRDGVLVRRKVVEIARTKREAPAAPSAAAVDRFSAAKGVSQSPPTNASGENNVDHQSP